MKTRILLYTLLFSITLFSQNKNSSIGFIENKGQIIDQNGKPNNKVKYLLNTNGLNVQIRENGFSYDIYETKKHKLSKKEIAKQNPFHDLLQERNKLPDYKLEYIYHRIDIDFLNSRKNAKIIAEEKSIDYDNYYNVIGKPEGVLNVHKYKQITYENIYPNIDVVFSIPNDSLKPVEYNFVIKPNGKISDIQLKFNGAKTELIDNKIKLNVRFGAMEETLPMSWIENGKSKTEVAINYKKLAKNIYGFESDVSSVDKTLIIDPVPIRLWGTLYGDLTNHHYSLGDVDNTIDSFGNLYMTGSTAASNSSFATDGAHQNSIPQFQYLSTNGIIVKFNTNGERIWGTYYGGTWQNIIYAVKLDSQNNVIITGQTKSSTNISTSGTHKENYSDSGDAFIAKFNQLGVRIWGTYFGGTNEDFAFGLDVDSLDNVYIVGGTSSTSGIAYNSNFQSQLYPSNSGYGDAFIAKFNSDGTIIWSTYAGGESFESFYAIAIKDNYLVTVGYTRSDSNIATNGVFQQNRYLDGQLDGQIDGVIYKFTNNGNRLWSSYYGGDNIDLIYTVEIDDEDYIYFGGQTASSSNNIVSNDGFQVSSQELYKGFFTKFSNDGSRIWGSYLDGLWVYSIVFKNNFIYLGATGSSFNNSLTSSCSYDTNISLLGKGYIGKFSKNCHFIWGSFIGGQARRDEATKIALNNINNIYVSGITSSNYLITDSNSHQQNILGFFSNYYLMKFEENTTNPTNIANNNPCIGNTLNLTASGGTNYSWTGPNGFTSSIQNPVINNAQTIHSGQYSCTITGTGGCDGTISTTVTVGDNTKPIPNQTSLPAITGDCNTTISTIPTATDNCAGIINGTTTDALSYALPGTYTINWKYDDGNGNIETQQQSIVITTVALPTLTSAQSFCIQQNPTLNSIAITGQNIKWYDAQTLGNLLPSSTILVNGSTYYASQTINSCESLRVPITINIQNTPAPTGNANQSFCATQNATLNEIVISGSTLNWYSSPSSTLILPTTTLLVNSSTYYASQTINGCESVNRFAVTITLTTTLNANNYSKSFCDDLDDGFETIILSDYNSFLLSSATNEVFTYYISDSSAENQIQSDKINPNYTLTTGTHTVFVRIDSSNGCHQVVELNLTLFSNPVINLKDIIPICENKDITVNAGNGFDSYTWSTGITNQQSILITQPGSYSLTVTKNNGSITCSSTKNFTVVNSNIASISSIETSDWTDNQNTISVFLSPSSVGNYEYSLDGIKYQDSPIFDNLLSGFYTVYVNDKNNCGEITDEVFILMYPTFFTPNNDGYNDYWKIKLSELEPGLNIKIFDRYGKFIKLLDNDGIGWDGTYVQKPLPADDYWFVITRANGKEYRNHFTLKR